MGEGLEQMYREVTSSSSSSSRAEDEDEDELGELSSLSGDSSDDEQEEDHAAKDSSSDSHAPLQELSSLVSQLPIKRGLSKFYQGKSKSLTSFSDVRSVEDLAKKETPIKRKMRPSRSYAGGLDVCQNNSYYGPSSGPCNNNRALPKRGPRGSCASSIAKTSSSSRYYGSGKPPPIPMHNKNM